MYAKLIKINVKSCNSSHLKKTRFHYHVRHTFSFLHDYTCLSLAQNKISRKTHSFS